MIKSPGKKLKNLPSGEEVSVDDALDRYPRWHLDQESFTIGENCLGKGQFGEVRLGKWNGTRVAVKNLYNFDMEENASLFEREIRLMKELHHPCVVQFLGFSTNTSWGGLAIIMEYLANGSVEDYILRNQSRVSLKQKRQWCSEMAQSLAYLHNRKPDFLIHRDVKPSNFMLSTSLVCKLGDFGISRLFSRTPDSPKELDDDIAPKTNSGGSFRSMARVASANSLSALAAPLTAVGSLLGLVDPNSDMEQTCDVGTARYMAPEVRGRQASSEKGMSKYSVQVDIFSLGMVYYFVFEGTIPRIEGARDPKSHFAGILAGKRPLMTRSPAAVRRIIELCLRIHPGERPTSKELIVLLDGVSFPTALSCLCSAKVDSEALTAARDLDSKIEQRKQAASKS